MGDVEKLIQVLQERFSHVTPGDDYAWDNAALNVIDCVLSLNRQYYSFVVPRIRGFSERHPDIVAIHQLDALIDAYATPLEFMREELRYRDEQRAQTLRDAVQYMLAVQDDYPGDTEVERLHAWAHAVTPEDSKKVGVRGFGLAAFQYMRMLFGAQTAKPDVYIKRFVSDIIGRNVSDLKALELLEAAAQQTGLPLRQVDKAIWDEQEAQRQAALALPPMSEDDIQVEIEAYRQEKQTVGARSS